MVNGGGVWCGGTKMHSVPASVLGFYFLVCLVLCSVVRSLDLCGHVSLALA